jgi:hypothetical protein
MSIRNPSYSFVNLRWRDAPVEIKYFGWRMRPHLTYCPSRVHTCFQDSCAKKTGHYFGDRSINDDMHKKKPIPGSGNNMMPVTQFVAPYMSVACCGLFSRMSDSRGAGEYFAVAGAFGRMPIVREFLRK